MCGHRQAGGRAFGLAGGRVGLRAADLAARWAPELRNRQTAAANNPPPPVPASLCSPAIMIMNCMFPFIHPHLRLCDPAVELRHQV